MNLSAAVWSRQGFTVCEVDEPTLAEGELLVAVELATVCGSDLHTVAGHRITPLPTVLGHEAVGHVVAAGAGAPAAIGDRVVWTIGTSCGACVRCRAGIPQKCVAAVKYGHAALSDRWSLNGSFATHVHLLSGTGVVPVPDDLAAAVLAPAGCATATVTCAVRRAEMRPGETVVVLGCGMLGMTAVAYALDRGAATVIACDPNPVRRAGAAELGATVVCDPAELDDASAAHDVDVVLEMSGHPDSVAGALRVVGIAGRVVLVGSVFPGPGVLIDPEFMVRNLVSMIGSHNYAFRDLIEAVDFLRRTPMQARLAALVSTPVPLTDIETAFAMAAAETHPRVGIIPA
ncbi:putative phosphonate catabolism associated alcohol dehydrogenase [Williamsia limnetica]|uniref:alcohol dehydrogenase n=1 Tax=Williamsia limnetica TaxID=882452 RepID=A0A318RLC7_WILLI|nr:zinc-binding dehydrogenase [Williamsia limnetica]PYE17600.1 putative phosphonate catabolism associated alcohol dehydrogenase [Williamsia limnetica]